MKLLVFDAYALIYRAYHAMPSLTTKNGEPINAIYGLTSMLITVIETLKPTNIVFAFDREEKTFRKELLQSYQSQRVEAPEDLVSQFSKAVDLLNAINIPIYSKKGFEADDVIGTITKQITENSSNKSDEVIVVTGDRDILQLVDDSKNIKLYMPITGMSNGKIYTEKETFERLGVSPKQIPDYKALVGDPSDNYFGIAGIGPKTAGSLLLKYKTLDGIYENLGKLQEKLREKLVNGKENAYLSYKLATIVRDVDINFKVEETDRWELASDKLLTLFENYGFKTLTARIKKLADKIEAEKQGNLF
jgi:DNA polymerase-1